MSNEGQTSPTRKVTEEDKEAVDEELMPYLKTEDSETFADRKRRFAGSHGLTLIQVESIILELRRKAK